MSGAKSGFTVATASIAMVCAVAAMSLDANARPTAQISADIVFETIYRPDCPRTDHETPEDVCDTRM